MKRTLSLKKKFNLSILGTFFLSGFVFALLPAAEPYEAIELGTLGYANAWYTEARGINDAGQVAGWSKTASGQTHAFFWENGVMMDLGTLGGTESAATAINEKGQVTGWSRLANGTKSAFIWDKTNGMRNIGTLSTAYSDCINEAGQVVGWRSSTSPLMWDPTEGLVNPWGSSSFIPYGINDAGQVVGARDFSSMPVIWEDGEFTDLGTLGGSGDWSARAMAINNAGQVVGYSETSTNTVNPFIWDEQNGMVNLLGITGDTGWAFSINEIGQVVGGSHVNSNSHVFLWDSVNGMVDLSEQLGLTDYLQGMDINNVGQIVAGRYILSPVPEPATAALLGLGAMMLRKRRK